MENLEKQGKQTTHTSLQDKHHITYNITEKINITQGARLSALLLH
uniref:Uncharacterized protein n=1 Tax=Anguilla anguilla TaxID=7936 RepID=A0A0E9R8F6_ANGAN